MRGWGNVAMGLQNKDSDSGSSIGQSTKTRVTWQSDRTWSDSSSTSAQNGIWALKLETCFSYVQQNENNTASYKPTGFSWSQDTHGSAQLVGNWTKLTQTLLTKRLRAIAKRMQDFDIGYVLICFLGLASLNWHRWASIIGVVGCYLAHLEWGATCWRNVEAFYSSFTLSLGYLVGWKPWSQADPAGFLTLTNSPPLH